MMQIKRKSVRRTPSEKTCSIAGSKSHHRRYLRWKTHILNQAWIVIASVIIQSIVVMQHRFQVPLGYLYALLT